MHTHTPLCPHTLEALAVAFPTVALVGILLWTAWRTRTADA